MSDFLKKLKEAVESGKPNEAIKAGFNVIVAKADGYYAASPQTMKELQEKAEKISDEKGEEVAKKLTLEEVNELNELAKEEEQRIFVNEQKAKVTSAVIMINCEIEELLYRVEAFKIARDKLNDIGYSFTYEEKEILINDIIKEIND